MSYYYILEDGQPMDGEFYHSDEALNRAVEYADDLSRIVWVGDEGDTLLIHDMGTAEVWKRCLEKEAREYQEGLAAERDVFYSHANRGTNQ